MQSEASDIDMDDAEQNDMVEDLEEGIIGQLDSPKVKSLRVQINMV
jgi:hypothetical protein